jgi:RNA polymerase sigma factor (sigma-70 family)
MPEDTELLELWRGGDEAAGQQIAKRYFDLLYRFFANKISLDADDLVQQTMLALLGAREKFEGRSPFRAYLLSIARFQLYEHLRKRKRAAAIFEYDEVTAYDLDPSPSTLAGERREHQLLLEALRRIPLNFQIALELHYWEDLTGPELAEVLGVPVDTAYSRVRKARELVRKQLKIVAAGRAPLAIRADADKALDADLKSAGRD